MIKHCVPMNPKRDNFFRDLNDWPMIEIEKKYLDCSLPKRIIASIKPLLYKLGVFQLYIKWKRK